MEDGFTDKYTRNRIVFALGYLCYLSFNAWTFLRNRSDIVIPLPTVDERLEKAQVFQDRFQNVTNNYIDKIEEENNRVQMEIEQRFQEENSRVRNLLQRNNNDILQQQLNNEQEFQKKYNLLVDYLQTWSRIGNQIPLLPNATTIDKAYLETSLKLEDGKTIKELNEESNKLKQYLILRHEYDQEYLKNKTIGLRSKVLATLMDTPTMELPNLDGSAIGEIIRSRKQQLIGPLTEIRKDFETKFTVFMSHLHDTHANYIKLSDEYESLLNTAKSMYSFIETVDILDINKFIDPDDFLPSTFFEMDPVNFPDVDIILNPLDKYISFLNNTFDFLEVDLLNEFNIEINTKVDTKLGHAFMTLREALTPNDYNPPTYTHWKTHKSMTPSEILLLDKEITENLTHYAKLPSLRPKIDVIPLVNISKASFTSSTFNFEKPKVFIFGWDISPLKESFDICMYWWEFIVNLMIINCGSAYIIYSKCIEKYDETEVWQPIIDLRTEGEKQDAARKKEATSSTTSKLFKLLRLIALPNVRKNLFSIIMFLISVGVASLVGFYYFYQFSPGCILSNNGTHIGKIFANRTYDEVLLRGYVHRKDHSSNNQKAIADHCQRGEFHVHEIYPKQLLEFENSKTRSLFLTNQQKGIENIVNFPSLCQQHKEACKNDSDSLYELECPIFEDDSLAIVDPCEMLISNSEISTMREKALELVDYNCNVVDKETGGNVVIEGITEIMQQELQPEKEFCDIEEKILGELFQLAFCVFSSNAFAFCLYLMYYGGRGFFWHLLREATFQVPCVANYRGEFTQPEYSDPEAIKQQIKGWNRKHRRQGVTKFSIGFILALIVTILLPVGLGYLDIFPSQISDSISNPSSNHSTIHPTNFSTPTVNDNVIVEKENGTLLSIINDYTSANHQTKNNLSHGVVENYNGRSLMAATATKNSNNNGKQQKDDDKEKSTKDDEDNKESFSFMDHPRILVFISYFLGVMGSISFFYLMYAGEKANQEYMKKLDKFDVESPLPPAKSRKI